MRRYISLGLWLIVALAGAAVASLLFVQAQTAPYLFTSTDQTPHTEVALVLGASVYESGELSPVLRERAERGVELYMSGKVEKILVTGDNSKVSHNEVNPVGKYMLERGVPKEDIFLDHAGFDTYSSMYRARDVFGVRSMTIVSQPFHLSRAVFIARSLNIEAYGMPAGGGGAHAYNSLREAPATVKALLDLGLRRSPKYLGEQFLISGSGIETWADTPLSTSTDEI